MTHPPSPTPSDPGTGGGGSTGPGRGFLARIDKSAGPAGCWPWLGYTNPGGYGMYGLGGQRLAHRISYEMFVGSIPEGLVIDHLCRNRSCVNPAHLEPCGRGENVLRSPITMPYVNAAKTHCPRGHEYSLENTYHLVRPDGTNRRDCRTCKRVLQNVRRAAA